MDKDIAIKVENLGKTFRIPHEKVSSIRGAFVGAFKGKRTYEEFKALDGVSFEVKKGEGVGMAGKLFPDIETREIPWKHNPDMKEPVREYPDSSSSASRSSRWIRGSLRNSSRYVLCSRSDSGRNLLGSFFGDRVY